MKEFLFIYLKITLFAKYLTVVTIILKLEVGVKTGHDKSGDLGISPKIYWKLDLTGEVTWGLAGVEAHFGGEN